MDALLKLFLDAIVYAWPFRLVEQWEKGGYYIFGRWWKPLEPGLFFVIPFFTDVKTCSIAEALVSTGQRDITLTNGTVLSFDAFATVRVVDPYKALNCVDDYQETVRELVSAVLSERLASVDASRLEPSGRNRLLSDLTKWVAVEASQYGIDVLKVRFASFLTNAKTHRVLLGTPTASTW